MNACTCPLSGYCDRHAMHKSPQWWLLCQTQPQYRVAWDQNRGPGQSAPPEVRAAKEAHRIAVLEYMRALWLELHMQAWPTLAWLINWASRVPQFGCGCRAWLVQYIKDHPIAPYWFAWTIALHNAVNAKLSRDLWTVERAISNYFPLAA